MKIRAYIRLQSCTTNDRKTFVARARGDAGKD